MKVRYTFEQKRKAVAEYRRTGSATRTIRLLGYPAMLLAAPYLLIAVMCRGFIEQGGPGWLNLLVIYGIYNATKIAWIGPISLIYLARARFIEYRARKRAERQAREQEVETPREYVAPQDALAMTGGAA